MSYEEQILNETIELLSKVKNGKWDSVFKLADHIRDRALDQCSMSITTTVLPCSACGEVKQTINILQGRLCISCYKKKYPEEAKLNEKFQRHIKRIFGEKK